jgi:putative DNA primase/helicase
MALNDNDPGASAFHPPVNSIAPVEDLGLTASLVRGLDLQGEFWMGEQGVALDFAEKNERRLRFVSEERAWIAWTGTHWSRACAETLAERFYSDLIAGTLQRAAEATGDKQREALICRAQLMGRRGMRSSALALARPTLMVSRDAFDRNAADLLNTPGGIVDLRTGAISPCDPERLLTQCTAIAYDPDETWPKRFDEIVNALADGDDETEMWLWRAIGYTLTGRVSEDAVFYLRGSGSNGKSTLLKALASVMGEYAHKIDIRYLTAGADQGHATEYAALRGKRLVFASEVEKGQRLAISRLKDLTGGDVQAHRGMHQDARDAAVFAPECKVWLAGNHDLAVHGTDHGTWRRLRKITSNKTFEHSGVRDSLVESEGSAILSAAVFAAGQWYEQGLGDTPAHVAAATAAYRNSQDLLGKFFKDCLRFEPSATLPKQDLTDAYANWLAEEGGDWRASPKELASRLADHGVSEGRVKKGLGRGRCWRGVRLARANDFADD